MVIYLTHSKKIAFGDNFDAIFSGWKTSSMLFQIPYHKLAIAAILSNGARSSESEANTSKPKKRG